MIYEYLPKNIGVYLNKKPIIDIKKLIELQKSNYVICIDGLAGSGKSTLGKHLARVLKIPHISSGIFYRVYTYIFTIYNLDFNQENIDEITKKISFDISLDEFSIIYNNQKIPINELKNDVIDATLNRFSSDLYFRSTVSKVLVKMVNDLRKSFILDLRGANPDYVRAIEENGRKVVRLLLVANTEVKAQRRLKEYMTSKYSKDQYYQSKIHQEELLDMITQKIIQRDKQDIESIIKTNIGLIHPDTGVIDTSDILEEQVTQLALMYIQNYLTLSK
ncbi:MAG: (d)CMP kinase [Patescibacteria group bacterium]